MSTAYTTEKTWVTGDDITAALLNTHIRDNSQFLHGVPSCRVFNSANLPVATGVDTALTFNSERKNNDSMHSVVTNTGRITATTAGLYLVGAEVEIANTSTAGNRQIKVRVNGVTDFSSLMFPAPGFSAKLNIASPYQFAAGDFVEALVFQDSGVSLNVLATGNRSPEFWAIWQAA